MMKNIFRKNADVSILLLRLGVGIVFLVHGIGKMFNVGPSSVPIDGFAGMLSGLGLPAPMFFAWLVAFVETFGGLFVLLGLFTRFSAAVLAVNILVATLAVHLPNGFAVGNGGYEFTMLLFFGSVALLFSGGGRRLVLEKSIFGKEFL